VLDGAEILYVDRAPSLARTNPKTDVEPQPGSRLPGHCTAMGELLLAYLPAQEQRELLSSRPAR